MSATTTPASAVETAAPTVSPPSAVKAWLTSSSTILGASTLLGLLSAVLGGQMTWLQAVGPAMGCLAAIAWPQMQAPTRDEISAIATQAASLAAKGGLTKTLLLLGITVSIAACAPSQAIADGQLVCQSATAVVALVDPAGAPVLAKAASSTFVQDACALVSGKPVALPTGVVPVTVSITPPAA